MQTALWVSALDLSPDGSELLVGALTAGWVVLFGGTNWLFDMDDLTFPEEVVGNWHDWEETGEGVTDGPRGGFWDADGNLYLADFYLMLFSIMLMKKMMMMVIFMSHTPMLEPY
ncbi:MAG: hypothetical protein CM15mP64_5200 [Candidatus Neomarinimicrobiota bacterium]|nr:MAG: hypothetical protein CM15mP64_5200 [Candidatus Neomarinimicrobiota bacterium]